MKEIHLKLTDEQLEAIVLASAQMGMEKSDFTRLMISIGFKMSKGHTVLFPYEPLKRGVKKKGAADQ